MDQLSDDGRESRVRQCSNILFQRGAIRARHVTEIGSRYQGCLGDLLYRVQAAVTRSGGRLPLRTSTRLQVWRATCVMHGRLRKRGRSPKARNAEYVTRDLLILWDIVEREERQLLFLRLCLRQRRRSLQLWCEQEVRFGWWVSPDFLRSRAQLKFQELQFGRQRLNLVLLGQGYRDLLS